MGGAPKKGGGLRKALLAAGEDRGKVNLLCFLEGTTASCLSPLLKGLPLLFPLGNFSSFFSSQFKQLCLQEAFRGHPIPAAVREGSIPPLASVT